MEIGELARANEMHPVAPAPNFAPPSAPPEVTVQYTLIVQPLFVTVVPSPLRPAEPSADTAMLVRVARVEPEWEFSGQRGGAGVRGGHAASARANARRSAVTTGAGEPSSQEEARILGLAKGPFWRRRRNPQIILQRDGSEQQILGTSSRDDNPIKLAPR